MLDRDLRSLRFHEADSPWLRSLSLQDIKCLIVGRGPVRKEAMDVFDDMGIREYGILLSEKDSIVYPKCLAPELRGFRFPNNVHRVPEYMGSGQEEKTRRIHEIIEIAVSHGYTHIFAGYGFMAEDAEFVQAIERSGVRFMGPSSHVANSAGAKDQAKKLARSIGVSVTPGVDNPSALALVRKAKDAAGLASLAKEHGLDVRLDLTLALEDNAEAVLQAGYAKLVELVTIEDLQDEAEQRCREIWQDNPGRRLRFKYIGGGGGKGQRVISRPDQVRAAVMDILAESKVVAAGANRNFLIELNVESTRHNEIQLIGNGSWCLSLGGRDCSVQMHEQKLVEVSLTDEQLAHEIETARAAGRATTVEVLESDRKTLARMESEGEQFGQAVQLDSVSTFEVIVESDRHYFMEVNTRIQVEHRVTEQVYRLKFTNPDDPSEHFFLDSLIEAMALLSVHGPRLPKPERVVRNVAGAEVRINATNAALQPHAGGVIVGWSPPVEGELRDDQGIGIPNPDTKTFIHYALAGAYDSNVALTITHGSSRADVLDRLADILRRTELRGYDLETNLPAHYGLLSWMLGHEPLVKPTTQFMNFYLAGIGALDKVARDLDLEHAWNSLLARHKDARATLDLKKTLLIRPMERLLDNAHLLGGFVGRYTGKLFARDGETYRFLANPIATLDALYDYLHLEESTARPPSDKIWDHDSAILEQAREFYAAVEGALGTSDYAAIDEALRAAKAPKGLPAERFDACKAAHAGFQLGLGILLLLPALARASRFDEIVVDDRLDPVFPDVFTDASTRADLHKALAPSPKASSDEIITPVGGMFYAREAPHLPPLAAEGMHFEAGQPLFVIEVMKMFNKISVPFSGTITRLLLQDGDGKIVKKGEAIFKIEPDDKHVEESPAEIAARRRKLTDGLLAGV
ncbi:MAG TPA: biotin carboxylase N-terminal domain-containing protein [Candidatus Binatia bacterium]|nr:biotin carboxylase N-terminal domain-containing protein [Candidatus Binatia bacterium]